LCKSVDLIVLVLKRLATRHELELYAQFFQLRGSFEKVSSELKLVVVLDSSLAKRGLDLPPALELNILEPMPELRNGRLAPSVVGFSDHLHLHVPQLVLQPNFTPFLVLNQLSELFNLRFILLPGLPGNPFSRLGPLSQL